MCKQFGKRVIGIMIAAILLGACAGEPLKVQPIAKTESPAATMEKLGQALSAAKQDRVDLYSPTWFALSQASYNKAKAGIDQGTRLSDILENLATGQAQLQQARIFADKSQAVLADVIQSRDAAITAGADKYQKEFKNLEEDFLNLSKAVEEKNMGYVKKRKKSVNDTYRTLELRAIKDTALGEARRLIAAARSQDMNKSAPKSFMIAQSKLADADAVITKDRYDKEKIAAAVREAVFYAQRTHQIAKTSTQFKQMAPEDIALRMEHYFAQTTTHLKEADHRDLSFDAQEEAILNAIGTLQRDQSSVASHVEAKNIEIEKLKQRIADLEGRTYQERADKERITADKERLAAEKRFNELYNKVQGYFSSSEAEVYKKAQQLVIRLKAIQFPVGQSVIMSKNYPLLTTVQKAIDTFGKPDVVIEGHTDSTGSEALNKQLSQKRADSVKQYLIYNGTLPANKMTAVGYGSARPLASNATTRGRAINRRIDVIIKPVQK